MFVKKLKGAGAVLLAAGIVVGAGMPAFQSLAAQLPAEKLTDNPRAEKRGTVKDAKEDGAPRVLKLDGRGRHVAWGPDNKTLVVVTKYGKGSAIQLWDLEKSEVRETLEKSTDPGLAFQGIAFSPDGKLFSATVGGGPGHGDVVKLWDTRTWAVKQTLEADFQLAGVAFSPDGKSVAAGSPAGKKVALWNAEAGALERTLETGDAQAWSVAFAQDGKTLAVGGQKGDEPGEVILWDTKTWKEKHNLKQDRFVNAVAFSPNSKLVAAVAGGPELRLWDMQKGELVHSLQGHGSGARSVAFSPNNELVAAPGSDNKLYLWDVETGKLTETLDGHEAEIYGIAFSRDGKTLVSVSQDQTARVWRIRKSGGEKK